ncbi:MAG: prepilin-type N-terminal cleavage/methylation domain-containing protein [Deltaproteobacteria bacterium]|jgi:prepilin-type N-terminal cleavage/methylation domain-containing protein|nr:prepilin-type N-terminal cleavage/methylation domain-containing protein [Deltaproteobacteria bacterium]
MIPAKQARGRKALLARGFAGARGGFTLVEVLITVAVIAFGCLAALLMQSASLRGNSMSDFMTVATFLSESEMERLKSLAYHDVEDEISSLGSSRTWWMDRMHKVCPGTTAAACGDYPFQVTLRFFPRYPTVKSTLAEVDVSWRDSRGTHSVFNSSTLTDLEFS